MQGNQFGVDMKRRVDFLYHRQFGWVPTVFVGEISLRDVVTMWTEATSTEQFAETKFAYLPSAGIWKDHPEGDEELYFPV